jgi:hypothetical protein
MKAFESQHYEPKRLKTVNKLGLCEVTHLSGLQVPGHNENDDLRGGGSQPNVLVSFGSRSEWR